LKCKHIFLGVDGYLGNHHRKLSTQPLERYQNNDSWSVFFKSRRWKTGARRANRCEYYLLLKYSRIAPPFPTKKPLEPRGGVYALHSLSHKVLLDDDEREIPASWTTFYLLVSLILSLEISWGRRDGSRRWKYRNWTK